MRTRLDQMEGSHIILESMQQYLYLTLLVLYTHASKWFFMFQFKFMDIDAHEEGNRLLFVDIINNTGFGMHSDLLRTTLGQVLLHKKPLKNERG